MPKLDHPFWEVYSELVEILFATEPSQRIGLIVPVLEEVFGPRRSSLYERIENHVMRTVAWMEEVDWS